VSNSAVVVITVKVTDSVHPVILEVGDGLEGWIAWGVLGWAKAISCSSLEVVVLVPLKVGVTLRVPWRTGTLIVTFSRGLASLRFG